MLTAVQLTELEQGYRQNPIKVRFSFNVLNNIETIEDGFYGKGKDIRKTVWIRIENPTWEEYLENQKKYFEKDCYEEEDARENYNYSYAQPYSYFEITFIANTDGYNALFVNNTFLFEHRDKELTYLKTEDETLYFGLQIKDILKTINTASEESADLISKKLYKKEILDNIPYRYRYGTTLNKNFIKHGLHRDIKEVYNFPQRKEFLNSENLHTPSFYLKEMTLRLFLKACKAGYKEAGFDLNKYDRQTNEIVGEKTPRECFLRYADGRDGGLLDIDENSFEAYKKWENNKERLGAHPWEVCRGGSTTHIDLCIMHKENKGYYFEVSGSSETRFIEAIKFYLGVMKTGYPVVLNNAELLKKRILGKELIGIVPHSVFPRYCESHFQKEKVNDFWHIFEEEKDVLPYIKWQKIEIPKIKKQ